MQIKRIALVAFVVVTLVACTSKTDPSEQNFKAAIDQYLTKNGALCLDFREWPQEINTPSKPLGAGGPNSDFAQLKALEAAGLVKSREIEKEATRWGKPLGHTYTITQFDLTEAGKVALRNPGAQNSRSRGDNDLCYGNKIVGQIVKWDAPASPGKFQRTTITYTYKIVDLAQWANDDTIKQAFPALKRILNGVGTAQSEHDVHLTNIGWEANERLEF